MVYWVGNSSSEYYTMATNLQDTLDGAGGNDTIFGYDGADTIYGGDGHDTIHGGDQGDWIHGGRGNDTLNGDGGDDIFVYGSSGGTNGVVGGLNSGWDTIDGGIGNDAIWIQNASGWSWTAVMLRSIQNVEEIRNNSSGPGYVYFETNIDFSDVDTLTNITVIRGQSNNNIFIGGDADENVEGLAGNDTLSGNNGNDTLNGGAGLNQLTGGAGNDIFRVSDSGDLSTILDFTQGDDIIQFTSAIAGDFSDLTITDDSGDAHVAVGTVDITLAGFDYTLLSASDFAFV